MMVPRHRVVSAVVAIGMIAVAVLGVRLSEAGDKAQIIRGSAGQVLSIRDGTLQVSQVRVGSSLKLFGRVQPTTGLFVVVRIDLAATGREQLNLQSVKLLAQSGVTYNGFNLGGGVTAEPGFLTTTELAYEVDPNRIDDLTIQLGSNEIVSGYQQQVQVHLGITAENAARWREAGAGQGLELAASKNRGIT
jgi:hypothetical protein